MGYADSVSDRECAQAEVGFSVPPLLYIDAGLPYVKLIFRSEMNTKNQIQHNVRIVVPPSNWGEGRRKDVETLISDTASHLLCLLRNPFVADIHVIPRPIDEYPEVMYRSPTETRYTIKLSARDRCWDKYAYQFAHEFCHVLSNYELLQKNPNNWFHEAICELASVFTLRCMAERWPSYPPYPNWASYADN